MAMKTHGHLDSTDPTDNCEADISVQIPSDLDFVSDADVFTTAVNAESLCSAS